MPIRRHCDQGSDVLDLALDLVWGSVTAQAAAAAVVVDHGELGGSLTHAASNRVIAGCVGHYLLSLSPDL